ncbi:MAG: hypothetical protein KatS3mg057_1199 [Herpetosiphonaceae bacterium]|nr:MAG: hypothetical protein KatS3mg057_1199 [Herpetosiphonaceae bacterium]
MRVMILVACLVVLLAGCGSAVAPSASPTDLAPAAAAPASPSATNVFAVPTPTSAPVASPQPPTATQSAPTPTAPLFPLVSHWQRIEPAGAAPPARRDAALAYDRARNRVILFGGRNGETPLDDTWAFDLESRMWQALATGDAPRPPARFSVIAGVDEERGRLLITTGQAGAQFFNDVWSFDLATDTWAPVDVAGEAPRPRYGSAGGILTGSGALYLSHGFSDQGRFDDTWAFDLAANTWRNMTPQGELPLKRCLHAAASAGPAALVLFGGCSSGFGPCPQGDTWLFDEHTGSWTNMTAQDGPSPRQFPSLVQLGDSDELLLFGGQGDGNVDLGDTWVLDVTSRAWSPLAPGGEQPAARYGHSLVWIDAATGGQGGVLLFGGRGGGEDLGDLWLLLPGAG